MTILDGWLQQATRGLAPESSARVRSEILEHYESAREAAVGTGASADRAERDAIASLGDPRSANLQYRRVLLTNSEMKLLCQGNWEAHAICARSWLKRALLLLPAAVFLASAILMLKGKGELGGTLLCVAIFMTATLGTPFLPVFTPARARICRLVKFLALAAAILLTPGWSERLLLFSSLSPVFWIEWQRATIRRKLPAARWPKQLYL